jgi:predicted RNA-binding protein with PUA-like domain
MLLLLRARRMPSSSSSSSSSSASSPRFWLLKGEPESHVLRGREVGNWAFSRIAALPSRVAPFFGVRNPQARSFLRDALRVGDRVFYYPASCKQPGVYGVCRVARAGYADDDALDAASPFFDAKHSKEAPRWYKVDLEALDSAAEGLARPVLLAELRADAARLADMVLLRQPRLSVQPVTPAQWARVLELSQSGGGGSVKIASKSIGGSLSAKKRCCWSAAGPPTLAAPRRWAGSGWSRPRMSSRELEGNSASASGLE